jgi:hypothetical protein
MRFPPFDDRLLRRDFLRLTALNVAGLVVGCSSDSVEGTPDAGDEAGNNVADGDSLVPDRGEDGSPMDSGREVLDAVAPDADLDARADAADAPDKTFSDRLAAARDVIEQFFRDGSGESLRALGDNYLDGISLERDEITLEPVLSPLLTLIETAPTEERALEDLKTAVAADFVSVDVVDLEGWTLGVSEIRLSAILALTA